MEEKFICKYCHAEKKNANSLHNHERLCKENPNRQESGFAHYNRNGHKGTNHFLKAKELGLPVPEHSRKGKYEKEYICPVCKEKFMGKVPFSEHLETHRTDNADLHHIEETKCRFCDRTFTRSNSLTFHEKRCSLNPNRVEYVWKGRHHSEETKDKLATKMQDLYKGKSIWRTQIEKRKSYAEQYFDECFPELKQNFHVDKYFLDLADPEKKAYIEVDGEQHYNDNKVIEHDKERTERLESLGWKLIERVRWSKFQKLTEEQKVEYVNILKQRIGALVVCSQAS